MKYAVMLLRYFKGYAHIKVTGGFCERFLNLCTGKKINMWNIFVKNNEVYACISRSHFLKLRPIAAKSGVKIAILKKTGLIYKYRKYNKRIGILTGITFFMVIHLLLSMFVWCVEVQGNEEISKTNIMSQAEINGLVPGRLKIGFDEIRTARNIASSYDGKITWLSVNIKGSLAVIELREDNKVIENNYEETPCNIVADFDGIILTNDTFCGDCVVKIGDGVKKGDMLISGAIINEDLSTTFYASDGKFTALHEEESQYTIEKDLIMGTLKSKKTSVISGLFGVDFPINSTDFNSNTTFFKGKNTLCINGYKLPFYIEKKVLYEHGKTKADLKKSSIIAYEKMQNYVYNNYRNSTVVQKNEDISTENRTFIYKWKYTLIDFIGEKKPILSHNQK